MPGLYTDVNMDALGQVSAPSAGSPDAPSSSQDLSQADDPTVFRVIDQIVRSQEALAKNRYEAKRHWDRVRRGTPFSMLDKTEDRAVWKAKLPPGIKDVPQPVPNKADDLCQKTVAQILVDPFVPNPKPEDEHDDRQKGASDLAKRFLTQDGEESGTNDAELFRAALDGVMTASGYGVEVWVDPQGGGWRPMQMQAHPQAVDAQNPLVDPTGQPTADYVLRYVTADGQFTEDPSQAAPQWLPQHERELLTPNQIRTVPATLDANRADVVVVLHAKPLKEAIRRLPELADLAPDQLSSLTEWRPSRAKAIVPPALHAVYGAQEQRRKDGQALGDAAWIFWYHAYVTPCGDYPDGLEFAVNGAKDGTVIRRATLRDDVPGPDGVTVPILRDIPVSQLVAWHDTQDGDPFGRPHIERFGPAQDGMAQLFGGGLEDVYRRLNPNVFIPSTSSVRDYQLTARSGKPIPILSKDDQPMYEQFADLPVTMPQMMQLLSDAMNSSSGLAEVAVNGDSQYSESGVAKQASFNATRTALAPLYQNFAAFAKRYWRIKLQLAQAKLTVPQQVQYTGIDSAYKQPWWTGADFVGVKGVAIQAGSGTMMPPAEKQQYVATAQQQQWLEPDEAAQVGRSSLSDDLGLQSRPETERIARELAAWRNGPPEGWTPAQPIVDPMTGQPPMDPTTGQPQVDPQTGQPPMQPASWTPFSQRPTDQHPTVAKLQEQAMREFIETSEYLSQPPEWRTLLDQRYELARQAAGIATVQEQQQAAAQQAQMAAPQKEPDQDESQNQLRAA